MTPQGVNDVEILQGQLDPSLVGLDVDNETKGFVLGVERVADNPVLIKTGRWLMALRGGSQERGIGPEFWCGGKKVVWRILRVLEA